MRLVQSWRSFLGCLQLAERGENRRDHPSNIAQGDTIILDMGGNDIGGKLYEFGVGQVEAPAVSERSTGWCRSRNTSVINDPESKASFRLPSQRLTTIQPTAFKAACQKTTTYCCSGGPSNVGRAPGGTAASRRRSRLGQAPKSSQPG